MGGTGRFFMDNKTGGIMRSFFLLLITVAGWASPTWIYLSDKGEDRSLEHTRISTQSLARRGNVLEPEDIPLHPRYLRMLEISGLRIRARSRWLNAVSVEGNSNISDNLESMDFVTGTEPVAAHRVTVPDASIHKIQAKPAIDSAHFGDTYPALQLLNIPAVHNIGIFGQGAKVGILDTGLKPDHPVFNNLKLGGEHDFITGDEIILWDKDSESTRPLLSNYEIVLQPELFDNWLFFIADSTGDYAVTYRALYAARLNESRIADTVFAISRILDSEGVVRSYAVSEEDDFAIVVSENGGVSAQDTRVLKWGVLTANDFQNRGNLDADSRNPFFVQTLDERWLFYVKSDSVISFDRAQIEGSEITWQGAEQVFDPGGILDRPKAYVSGDTAVVFALDLKHGKFSFARTTDNGESFAPGEFPVSGEVVAFDIDGNRLVTAENHDGGFRLHFYQTPDAGQTWSDYAHPEVFDVIDRVDLASVNGLLKVVLESAGQVFLVNQLSSSLGDFSESHAISPEYFCYRPHACSSGSSLEVVWVYRGDDDTDYDPTEDGIDANEFTHPAHGSRVAGLIAGYQGMLYVGAAPAAEIYVAKTEKHVNLYGLGYELRAEEDMWIEGLEWLERSGVDIVNSSLGYGEWYTYEERDGKASPASRAATMAAERGVLVVNSAGNVKTGAPYILPPADAEGIITAGGVDTLGNWWEQSATSSGSAVGPTADGRTKPDLAAPALGVYVIDVDDTLSQYFFGSGTSYAAPILSGSAALMLEVHPEYRGNPDTIITLLKQSATLASSPNDTLGWGIPDVFEALKPLPDTFDTFSQNELIASFPNPFYPRTQDVVYFPFRLNKASLRVRIHIYTLSGEKVLERELIPPESGNSNQAIGIGRYDDPLELSAMGAYWDGLTQNGQQAASGLYLVLLTTQYGSHASKFMLIR
ncbi:S8 family serine peptidase [candidate division WOR-3 bacterium]|uniref:S8 family serine peptidase n=1 Tax=candidate division WOR-3 bacterium TaxID=2052148 RepID=A0A9D5K934_UNCW3|nr:S8 family serine peptidase [candidate division WOR-3 bacterium]MBD3364713.1 S8 family serine peptidase [candidate division WOR-3 bacterium]